VALLVVLTASACRVNTEVDVAVKENGSGSVTVRVGLDDDALRREPNIAQELKTADLGATGWTVSGPAKSSDGLTYFSATKPFATTDEAAKVLAEVSGPNGPFRGFTITSSRSFARTKFSFRGTVDFHAGLEAFSDSQLAAQLDGKPLGDDLQALAQRAGQPLDQVFQFRVAVQLPGSVTSNAPVRVGSTAVWQPSLAQPAPQVLAAHSTSTRWVTVVATLVAAIALLALVTLVVIQFMSRRHGRQPRHAASSP
jgi:hypothetical protein